MMGSVRVVVGRDGNGSGWHMVTLEALSHVREANLRQCIILTVVKNMGCEFLKWKCWGNGGRRGVVGLQFGDVWRWPELKRATFWFWTGPVSGRLGGHKAGWGLRIMAAEGRGGWQLANSAPICFHERGEEISEDAMPERHARRQKGRLKIKLVNILPVSPHDAHFSMEEGGGTDCSGHSRYNQSKKRNLTFN